MRTPGKDIVVIAGRDARRGSLSTADDDTVTRVARLGAAQDFGVGAINGRLREWPEGSRKGTRAKCIRKNDGEKKALFAVSMNDWSDSRLSRLQTDSDVYV